MENENMFFKVNNDGEEFPVPVEEIEQAADEFIGSLTDTDKDNDEDEFLPPVTEEIYFN